MYHYQRAVGVSNKDWVKVVIDTVPLEEVKKNYPEVLVVVTHSTEPNKEMQFDLYDYLKRYPETKLNVTIVEHLRSIGNRALPTTDELTDITKRIYAEYRDIGLAGYQVKPYSSLHHHTNEVTIEQADSFLLTREDMDYSRLAERCLVNVNGYYHITEPSDDGLKVSGGLTSFHRTKTFSAGLLDLGAISDFSLLPVEESMLYFSKPIPNDPSEVVYFNLGRNINDYVVYGCFGGVIEWDNPMEQVGDGTVRLQMNDYPLTERFLNCVEHLQFNTLERAIMEDEVYALPRLYLTPNLIEYFCSQYSFFVLVHNSENKTYLETVNVQHTGLAQTLTTQEEPIGVMVNTDQIVMNYITVPNSNNYSVAATNDLMSNYHIGHFTLEGKIGFSKAKDLDKPYSYTHVKEQRMYKLQQ